ncbi:MAG: acyl-CoA reductase [Ginsengibacter sp.]
MALSERIQILVRLGKFLLTNDEELTTVKRKAFEKNKWFTEEFIDYAFKSISESYLDETKLKNWVNYYHIDDNIYPRRIGIVMAGNIPLVGFHDFLCVFVSGHYQEIKLSDKDDVLLPFIIKKLAEWDATSSSRIRISETLKNCEAYIATGSNNSARYFHRYFGRYPSIIRNNKTSVALLTGDESEDQLILLADDVNLYFGLGCRNVTQLWVPENYNFELLLHAFKKYNYFKDITKYRNNYDYNLALFIMNNKFYMTNESIILSENSNPFSPVSVLHYSYYKNEKNLSRRLKENPEIQCIVGENTVAFGKSQQPGLFDYADGIDTMEFLLGL